MITNAAMKRAIITGATGIVGTALVSELISHGVEVLAIDRKDAQRDNHLPKKSQVVQIYHDLEELESLSNETGKQYDVLYHLGWKTIESDARNDSFQLQQQNIKHTLDAVRLAKRFGCKTFIGIGDQSEYGCIDASLGTTSENQAERNYSLGKLWAGMMSRELSHQLCMKYVWVRLSTIYGYNDNVNSMMMKLIVKLKNGEVPEIDGEKLYDFLFCEDAAKALYLLWEKGHDGKVYFVGSGKARPLREYAEVIRNVINPEISFDYSNGCTDKNKIMTIYTDISAITMDTGWLPELSFENRIFQLLT